MSEKIRLSVNRANLNEVVSTILSIQRLIENRDIGDIVATPVSDFFRANNNLIKITVVWYNAKEPPYYGTLGYKRQKITYNIPDITIANLDWQRVKQACGGNNGFLWGRFRATANLDNGRQMQVYGGSEKEAETMLKSLLTLSKAKITTLSIAEEKKEGLRATNKKLYKETTRVYPAYFSVINTQKIFVESGRELANLTNSTQGTFRRSRVEKIPLWVEKEPRNYQATIREAIRVRGS